MNCPACHGEGVYVEEYLEGIARTEQCGFCLGKGILRKKMYYRTLGYLSGMARSKKLSEKLVWNMRLT
jgi:DnaJ-class molecular chaperone